MKINVPRSDAPLTRVIARTGDWCRKIVVGRPYSTYELAIPEWIDEQEVEVTAELCTRDGRAIDRPIVIKEAIPRILPAGKVRSTQSSGASQVTKQATRKKTSRHLDETAEDATVTVNDESKDAE